MSSRGRPVGNGAPRTSRPTRCAWRACADMARCVVGADVLGGPRTRGRSRWRPVGNGAPRTSRPTRCAHGVRVRRAVCVCEHGAVRGRGRRPRRPAYPWASPMAFRGRGAPRTSRPTRCAHARCAHGVRVRRAVCVCGHGAVRGRGRRPRRPACPWVCPMASRGQRRAEDVAPYHGGVVWNVVGADVLGGPCARGRPICSLVADIAVGRGQRCESCLFLKTSRRCPREKCDSLPLRLLCVRNGILRRTCGADAETVYRHVDVERLK